MGLAVGLVLAGCSGSSSPSAADRSICNTVRSEFTDLPAHSATLPSYIDSESKQVLRSLDGNSNLIIWGTAAFVTDLLHSQDATFRRLGNGIQHGSVPELVSQLRDRCSALGL